jgi:hypothetical protein
VTDAVSGENFRDGPLETKLEQYPGENDLVNGETWL